MPSILSFPDRETLQLALATGAVPSEVAEASAEAAIDEDGPLVVRPSLALSRRAWGELKRLGVQSGRASDLRSRAIETVTCWPQLLPLRRDPNAETLGPTTPVVFELPGDQLPSLAGEILRLGNDRQGVRWLSEGDSDEADQRPPRALLRAVGPPFYTLLRAIDRDGRPGGLRAFVERAPRLLVELGYTHPMIDRLRPPPGQLVMIEAPRRWTFVEEEPFRDLYETIDIRLPASEAPRRGVEWPSRLSVALRLARAGETGPSELWVLRERAEEQLDDLVRRSDDRLLSRLAFAVAEGEGGDEGGTLAVVRVRPSKRTAPVLVLDGVGYRPYLRLPNLFLPLGTRLQPPLRRDAVARLLANDPARVSWLAPGESGTFTPESLPDDAFRPLEQWVD